MSIVAIGCLHPVLKVQSASMHFFLGDDDEKGDSEEEEEVCFPIRQIGFDFTFPLGSRCTLSSSSS